MSTYEFTATITAAGQIEVPSDLAEKLKPGERAQVTVKVGETEPLPRGTPIIELLNYAAGLIPPDELKRISDAIEEEFETIDPNEWQ